MIGLIRNTMFTVLRQLEVLKEDHPEVFCLAGERMWML